MCVVCAQAHLAEEEGEHQLTLELRKLQSLLQANPTLLSSSPRPQGSQPTPKTAEERLKSALKPDRSADPSRDPGRAESRAEGVGASSPIQPVPLWEQEFQALTNSESEPDVTS